MIEIVICEECGCEMDYAGEARDDYNLMDVWVCPSCATSEFVIIRQISEEPENDG